MKLSKLSKVLLGIGTVWPPIYMIGFMATLFVMFVTATHGRPHINPPSSGFPGWMLVLFTLHLLTMLDMMVLLVVYVMHVFKNDKLDANERTMWAVLMFVGSFIVMPIYYVKYIWPGTKTSAA